MSSIGIEIQGTQLTGSIDVDSMRDRLTSMRDRLQQEIDGGNNSERLADRLNKVNSQIERLERLSDQNVTVTADRARAELESGMRYLSEGMKFLENQGEGQSTAATKVGRWYDHLNSVYRTIDRHA
ncbi:MAG: hypothetical protein IT430_13105 [Phycisphaerales bacterium]|nr:hypothetical protein [Phycisphaerales bacterium]